MTDIGGAAHGSGPDEPSPVPDTESRALLLRKVPIVIGATSGRLLLSGGRLTFTKSKGAVIVDLPVAELHSVSASSIGLIVWHGTRRFRFAVGPGNTAIHGTGAVGGVLAIAQLPGEIKAYKTGVAMIAAWVDAIKAQAHGVPPDGLKIHKPWGTVKTVLVVVAGATVLVVGPIVIALVLTSK